MKKFSVFVLSLCLCSVLTGCGNTGISRSESVINQEKSSVEQEKEADKSSPNLSSSPTESGAGDAQPDYSTDERYQQISVELINYVGKDRYQEWTMIREELTIRAFLEHFQIPQDVFTNLVRIDYTAAAQKDLCELLQKDYTLSELQDIFGYSLREIEALYSQDQKRINQAFCGPLAFVNEADGELYSIYWLAEHTPEEYIEAGLPLEEVEAIIEKAASKEFGLTELAETAQSKLTCALSLKP